MNSAQNTPVDDAKTSQPISSPVSSGVGKEHEATKLSTPEVISAVGEEVELPKEVEKAGVEIVKETIELPPDVKKLGVTLTGAQTPVITTTLPQVTLPISDQTVVVGLHAQVLSSLRWLAVWCVKKLKKAHIVLKQIHGKIIRVKSKT